MNYSSVRRPFFINNCGKIKFGTTFLSFELLQLDLTAQRKVINIFQIIFRTFLEASLIASEHHHIWEVSRSSFYKSDSYQLLQR